MSRTKISWTQWTWNMIGGCTPVSEGCLNCAAAKSAARGFLRNHPLYKSLTKNGKYTGEIRLCTDIGRNDILEAPLHIKQPTLIFVEFMGDLFHKDVPFEFIDKVSAVMSLCQQHTFQVLTKRIDRAVEWIFRKDDNKYNTKKRIEYYAAHRLNGDIDWPLPNVHIGTSCENQKTADERIPLLLQIPAAKKFISFEPLLGDIGEVDLTGIDQVIIGAESIGGHAGRECKLEWIRNIVAQAKAAGCKVHVKQLHLWGTNKDNAIYETAEDAKLHFGEVKVKKFLVKKIEQFPEDLRIQEHF